MGEKLGSPVLVLSLEKMVGIKRVITLDFLLGAFSQSFKSLENSHRASFDVSGPPGDGWLPHPPFKGGLLPAEERPVAPA